jgi:hypothetical protein
LALESGLLPWEGGSFLMRFVATSLLAVSLLLLSGCAAVERRLNHEGTDTGCVDCESHCWPAGRPCWTRKCLCEPWIEECRSSKLPICSPCDRQEAREQKAKEAADVAAEEAAEEAAEWAAERAAEDAADVSAEAVHDVPETSPGNP